MSEQKKPTILVVGATGRVAGMVTSALSHRGMTVRALVRAESNIASAQRNGATHVVIGDLRNPDSLAAAVSGVDGVFHIGPAFTPDEAEMGCNIVAAAKREGVKKFVFSSVIQPTHAGLANHRSKALSSSRISNTRSCIQRTSSRTCALLGRSSLLKVFMPSPIPSLRGSPEWTIVMLRR